MEPTLHARRFVVTVLVITLLLIVAPCGRATDRLRCCASVAQMMALVGVTLPIVVMGAFLLPLALLEPGNVTISLYVWIIIALMIVILVSASFNAALFTLRGWS